METKTKSKSIITIILSIAMIFALFAVTLFAGCGTKKNTASTEGSEQNGQNQSQPQSDSQEKVSTCTATFDANGGAFEDGSTTQTAEQTVIGDDSFSFKKDANAIFPTRNGYNFVGWGTTKSSKRVVENYNLENSVSEITYYAIWTNKTSCYCYFSANGGYFKEKSTGKTSVVYGVIHDFGTVKDGFYRFKKDASELLDDFEIVREGYEFAGFASTADGTTPVKYFRVVAAAKYQEDFYAIWKEVKTSTFDANGGTFANKETTLSYSQTMQTADDVANFDEEAKDVPTRDGYTFLGWSKIKSNVAYTIVKDFTFESDEHEVTYYAIWTQYDKITVTFNAIGGEFVDGKFVLFEDGDNNGTFAGNTKTQTYTKYLTAAKSNGYYGFAYEAGLVKGNNAPTKDGYVFKGWAKKAGTTVKYFSIPATLNSYTYYAVWESAK